MSLSSTTNRNDYIGNGAVDTYAYGFKIFANTDLRVTVRDEEGDETTLVLTTDYTVTGVGASSGGNVVLVNSAQSWLDADGDLDTDFVLTIRRIRPITQAADIRNQGEYFPETHEDVFDKLVMIDQQQQDDIDRCMRLPETVSSDDFDTTLPTPEANKYVVINDDGDGFDLASAPTATDYSGNIDAGLDANKSASPATNDVYFATDTRKIYVCYSTGTWTCSHNGGVGTNIASATTTDIGAATGEYLSVTGTTTITGLGTVTAGIRRHVTFTGALTLTHNATSLILPGGANITTAAGDMAIFRSLGSGNWKCELYQAATGKPIVASTTFPSTVTHSAAINEAKGADIASATTTDIGAATGNAVDVTGTTTITGLGTVQAGTRRIVRFMGALTLTHHATALILPGAANITTAAGDVAEFISLGSGNWYCASYVKASGQPVIAPTMSLVAVSDAEVTGTSSTNSTFKSITGFSIPATSTLIIRGIARKSAAADLMYISLGLNAAGPYWNNGGMVQNANHVGSGMFEFVVGPRAANYEFGGRQHQDSWDGTNLTNRTLGPDVALPTGALTSVEIICKNGGGAMTIAISQVKVYEQKGA